MTKIRKYNGVYKLPIKKHTKVRRPESKYRIAIWGDNHSSQSIHDTGLVKDISKGLENPLTTDRLQRDINAFRKKFPPIWPAIHSFISLIIESVNPLY